MKKVVFFTIADEKNISWAKGLERSFKKFHPDIDFKIYGPEYVAESLKQDADFFYKATPWIARDLITEYELVVKIDADSVVCGELDHIINDPMYEVGCVLNFNNRDSKQFGRVEVFNIIAERYMNCGLVAMTSKRFIDHWWSLCNSPVFHAFRYREQDLLNIIYYYGNYRVTCFDDDGKTLNGLANKDYWHGMEMIDGVLKLPVFDKPNGKIMKTVDIKVIHWAGGNTPGKMNFDLRFSSVVSDYLKKLTQYE